jgi:hypothetical protein
MFCALIVVIARPRYVLLQNQHVIPRTYLRRSLGGMSFHPRVCSWSVTHRPVVGAFLQIGQTLPCDASSASQSSSGD